MHFVLKFQKIFSSNFVHNNSIKFNSFRQYLKKDFYLNSVSIILWEKKLIFYTRKYFFKKSYIERIEKFRGKFNLKYRRL